MTIVTPWLGHPELAEDYVDAVLPELGEGDAVLIVDNGEAPLPLLPFRSVTPERNLGFARGSNLGLELAQTEAVLFLNNDVAPVWRGWLEQIRAALAPHVLAGPLRDDPHAAVDGRPMPYIDGWCLAGRREDLLALGGFDESLEEPAYYSDNLLCLEARAQGMTLRDVPVHLRHKFNSTAGSAMRPEVQAATAANRARYLARARALLAAA